MRGFSVVAFGCVAGFVSLMIAGCSLFGPTGADKVEADILASELAEYQSWKSPPDFEGFDTSAGHSVFAVGQKRGCQAGPVGFGCDIKLIQFITVYGAQSQRRTDRPCGSQPVTKAVQSCPETLKGSICGQRLRNMHQMRVTPSDAPKFGQGVQIVWKGGAYLNH